MKKPSGSGSGPSDESTKGGKGGVQREGKLPPAGVPVLVQGLGYRCLATRDKTGKWRSFPSGLELTDVKQVLSE
jgi:hypothetical protein